jgi:pyruvate,water dikinase
MKGGNKDLVFLDDKKVPEKQLLNLVGGKSANLMRVLRKRLAIDVPPGFTITTKAFLKQCDVLGIKAGAEPKKIRRMLMTGPLDPALEEGVLEAVEKLGVGMDIVVRSSATAEDLEDASFAGQQETFLDIGSKKELLDSIKACWASAFADRAVSYRDRLDMEGIPGVAVLIQVKVDAMHAGVAFSHDPLGSGCAVVEVVKGLGESLVSGEAQPARYYVKGDGEKVVHKEDPQKIKLPDKHIISVSQLSQQLQDALGFPADIEWAHDRKGGIHLLQARPITSIATPEPINYVNMHCSGITDKDRKAVIREEMNKIKKEKGEWTQKPLNERIVMPMSDWELSILPLTIDPIYDTLGSLGFKVGPDAQPFTISFGKPYINVTFLRKLFSGMPEAVDMILASGHTDQAKIKPRVSIKAMSLGTKLLGMVGSVLKDWEKQSAVFNAEFDRLGKLNIRKMDYKRSVKMLDDMLEQLKLVTPIHFRSVILAEALFNVLVEFLRVMRFKDADERATRLVGGLKENVTVRTNLDLMKLAQPLKRSDTLKAEAAAGKLADRKRTKQEQRFIAKFDKFLEEYGHRDPVHNTMFPTWKEDPATVLSILVSMSKGDAGKMSMESSVRQRIETEKETLNKLKRWTGKILPVRATMFKRILWYTRAYMVLRENQQFVMGRAFPLIRQNLMHIGGMLSAKGLLDSPFEGFFLTQPELKKGAAALLKRGEIDIPHRMTRFGVFCEVEAPIIYNAGEVKTIERSLFPDRAGGKAKRSLQGVGVSPGTYEGPAHVMLEARELHRFEPGEVLVCSTTNPAWTPVFPLAGAIVTDVGGMLSHGAVVAREYKIPAVLGTGNCTTAIRTGDVISIDGAKGKVRIVKRSK